MLKLAPWLNNKLEIFKSQILSDNLHHALLINGKKGIGKQNLAFVLAHMIVIPNEEILVAPSLMDIESSYFEPFKNWPYSIESINFISTDSDKSDQISIDQIRSISSTVYFKNNIHEKKVVVISNINNLTISAQNALLKIVEEPPKDTYFILLHDENTMILPTIRSRCSHYSIDHMCIDRFIGDYINLKILNQFNFNLKEILSRDRDDIINQSIFIDSILSDIYNDSKSLNLLKISKEIIDKQLFTLFLNSCMHMLFDIICDDKRSLRSTKNIYRVFDKINTVNKLEKHNFNREMFLVGLIRQIQDV
jgi:hypothetical protein